MGVGIRAGPSYRTPGWTSSTLGGWVGGWGNSRPLPATTALRANQFYCRWLGSGQGKCRPLQPLHWVAVQMRLNHASTSFFIPPLPSLPFSHHTDPNLPPPKPKKPPKELVDRYSLSTLSGNSTRGQPLSLEESAGDTPTSIRSRTMSMFQTLFGK